MSAVRYAAPQSVEEALQILNREPDARPFAGGTDLLIQYRAGLRAVSTFVDLKRIPALVAVAVDAAGLRLGAAASAAQIAETPDVARLWPGLAETVNLIGSTQIQGRGSVGGNLCNGSPAADTTCALMVNRAVCVISGPSGQRRVPVEAFVTGPGRTALSHGELLVTIEIPRRAPGTRTCE
jgi:carbon-monoxide dehydrogenase medium subunit